MARKPPKRQEEIAREMGLLPPLVPTNKGSVPHLRPKPRPKPTEHVYTPIPDPHAASCPGGRHKLPDGRWCINGRIFDHGEVFRLKQLEMLTPGAAAKVINNKALRMLDKFLGLDYSAIKIS